MYDDHYGLTGRPFQLTPDPRFWFDTATHRKAMAYLGYGLSQGEGFVVVTGEPGVGKTTLMGHLLGEVDRERLKVVTIVSTQLRPDDLLRVVCAGLDIDAEGAPKATMLAAIERALQTIARDGQRTLLIVDEAQALPVESLEELRMLSNFQLGGYPLLQIFLLGQPEFRATLQDARLEQLRQRVIAMHHLAPMGLEELEPYLLHRLACVGWRGRPRFMTDAILALYRWSGGVPRRVNQLASRVMLFGAVEQIDSFSGPDVEAVIADLDSDTGMLPAAAAEPQPEMTAAHDTPAAEAPVAAPARVSLAEAFGSRAAAPMPAPEAVPAPEADGPAAAGAPQTIVTDPRAVSPLRAVAEVAPAPESPAVPEAPAIPAALDVRLAAIERQLGEQDEALRRVLTLLVDWVENGDTARRPDISALRGNAA